jgi:hypothetical protein
MEGLQREEEEENENGAGSYGAAATATCSVGGADVKEASKIYISPIVLLLRAAPPLLRHHNLRYRNHMFTHFVTSLVPVSDLSTSVSAPLPYSS